MKQSFIHNPVFRLLSPLVAGILAYLLILLFSNAVQDIAEEYVAEEFYVCLLLAFIIQETIRYIIKIRTHTDIRDNEITHLLLELLAAVIICILLVCLVLNLYFKFVLGYLPNGQELMTFNAIYIFIPILYSLIYGSHKYLYAINKEKLDIELAKKKAVQLDFHNFKKEINPNLLFESFETLIIKNYDNKIEADDLIDHLSIVYRYILSEKDNELTSLDKEIKIGASLIALLNLSETRDIHFKHNDINQEQNKLVVIPGALLTVLQNISETFINSGRPINIQSAINQNTLSLKFDGIKKIEKSFNIKNFDNLQFSYSHFTEKTIAIIKKDHSYEVQLPILELA